MFAWTGGVVVGVAGGGYRKSRVKKKERNGRKKNRQKEGERNNEKEKKN
jgi:hypothetical protein